MKKMTRNSNALMRDGSVMANSDLVDFLSGSTDSAINFSGSADLHIPINPSHCVILDEGKRLGTIRNAVKSVSSFDKTYMRNGRCNVSSDCFVSSCV